jgi:Na+/proline symporter
MASLYTSRGLLLLVLLAALAAPCPITATGGCIADESINSFFETEVVGEPIPVEGSCCQADVCGLPCPEYQPPPTKGYGIAVGVAIAFFCAIGFGCYFLVRGDSANFFVAGRTLPLFVCALTLASQSLDSNALLGNADLSYKYHFYDGAALPIGLAISLFLNAAFLARHINSSHALTLPEIYGQNYGVLVEVLVSLVSCASFVALLAGNLVGMSTILGYIYGLELIPSVFISGGVMLVYTMCGGLFSVAYSDVVQSITGITGCLVTVIYFMATSEHPAPPPSIGFPKQNVPENTTAGMSMYPDNIGDGGVCDMYQGVPCEFDESACCYNQQLWCPSADNCTADNGAYPVGDQRIFYNQMQDPYALTPFPNAILFNWSVIIALSFGNLAALDFQARNLAAKTAKTATVANVIAGCLTLIIGVPFAYMGAITRYHYGIRPPSPRRT